jgi:hypothetical protein
MPSKSKTSIATISGATSTAARTKALLYEPFLRLPAKAKILKGFCKETTAKDVEEVGGSQDLRLSCIPFTVAVVSCILF